MHSLTVPLASTRKRMKTLRAARPHVEQLAAGNRGRASTGVDEPRRFGDAAIAAAAGAAARAAAAGARADAAGAGPGPAHVGRALGRSRALPRRFGDRDLGRRRQHDPAAWARPPASLRS